MTESQPKSGPTARRRILGAQLRRLREAAGFSRDEAAEPIRASGSKMSRLELGRNSFKLRDVRDLLLMYGVTDEDEREKLLNLARLANEPGWWQSYSDLLPTWFQTFVDLEGVADRIRTYEVQFIPGLMQTEDYARAATRLGHSGAPSDEVERRVSLRMTRQRLLTRSDSPRLGVVIDEAALRRPIGGSEVMRAQLEYLISVGKLPNVRLQVMPLRFGGHAAEGGAFHTLRFNEPQLPDMVYVEHLTGALYLDERKDVDPYMQAMERLVRNSASEDRTVEIINDIRKEY